MLWYTIYDPETDDVVASGTSQECAGAIGVTPGTFQSYVCNARKGRYAPYTIVIEDTDTGKVKSFPSVPPKGGNYKRGRKNLHRRGSGV